MAALLLAPVLNLVRMTPEMFEEMKKDFIQKNAAFINAVSNATFEDFNQIEKLQTRSSLHLGAASSYSVLVSKMSKKLLKYLADSNKG